MAASGQYTAHVGRHVCTPPPPTTGHTWTCPDCTTTYTNTPCKPRELHGHVINLWLRHQDHPADAGTSKEGGGHDDTRMGLVNHGRQSAGDSAAPCTYCGVIDGHTSDCPVIS